MDATRISLARALELDVRVSWREAAAIVHQALALTVPVKGARPARVGPEDCVLTRGGEVLLSGVSAKARPESVVALLDHLLASCNDPGRLAGAVVNGTAIEIIEELSLHVTDKRRRVEVAAVALRALAAEADAARALREGGPAPDEYSDFDLNVAEPPLVTAPTPASVAAPAAVPVRPPPPAAEQVAQYDREFGRLREVVLSREEDQPSRFDAAGLGRRISTVLNKRVAAGVAAPALLFAVWMFWPASAQDQPTSVDLRPQRLAAMALDADGASSVGRTVPSRTSVPSAATPPPATTPPSATAPSAVTRPSAAAAPVPPPATAAVAARRASPSLAAPSTATPVAVAASPVSPATVSDAPSIAAPSAMPPARSAPVPAERAPARAEVPLPAPVAANAPGAAPSGGEAASAVDRTTVYSWTNAAVEPPTIRYPAMPSSALPPPDAAVDGPYFEVLVDDRGDVETVRLRGRVEPGETFYRHSMMLASAKLWRFTPARLDGRAVRYVVRVVIDP